MNQLLASLLRGYRATGVPRLEQQARDLADAMRRDHEELQARLVRTVSNWRPTTRGYTVEEL